MKRVLLDCDGILADFTSGALAIINEQLDASYVPADVTRFDIGASLGLTREQAARFKRAIGDTFGFARALKPYDGAIDGVRRLREIAEVLVVTSPWNSNPTWTHDREWWLEKHFGIKHGNVIHTSAKHVCVGDVFVDDKTDAVAKWRAAHQWTPARAIRWDTLHNQLDDWDGERTSSWDRLVAIASAT